MSRFALSALRDDLGRAIAPQTLSTQIKNALALAYTAHEGQFREQKDRAALKVPYIVHPVDVAKIAASLLPHASLPDSTDDILSAALTHDVLEDSSVSLGELELQTSVRTGALVMALTKPSLNQKMSRTERNRAFLEQIKASGPSARFIKICDAMHNLSRPNSMPVSLLRKTIDKATTDYLELADHPRLDAPVREALEAAIRGARAHYDAQSSVTAATARSNLAEALAHAADRTRSKVLEVHDIAELMESLSGARPAFVGTASEFSRLHLSSLVADRTPKAEKSLLERLESGSIDLDAAPFHREQAQELGILKVLSTPLPAQDSSSVSRRLFVTITATTQPWLDQTALLALTSIMAQRLHDRDARQLTDIADALARLDLALDPRTALQAGFNYSALLLLRARLDAARFVHDALRDGLRNGLEQAALMGQIDRLESRVKAPASIARKLLARRYDNLEELDDLVGVRIIVLSTAVQRRVSQFLQEELSSETSDLGRMLPIDRSTVQIIDIRSDQGYKAVHVRFGALTPTRRIASITCEIQIRTLFEDAWARISQIASYKKTFGDRTTAQLLAHLAEVRDECDEKLGEHK